MQKHEHPLSQEEFDSIYARVPRLTVEIIIKNEQGAIYLAKRAIPPCEGQWHLPGGTVRFGEPMIEAVKRIAHRELNVNVVNADLRGYIEYPSHYLNGLDSPVGVVFEVITYSGIPSVNMEASVSGWFKDIPEPMHADQDEFLLKRKFLLRT